MPTIHVARVYDPPDGTTRVLVDRLWPRGLSKKDAQIDEWPKTLAPSTDLRKWYGHSPDRFDEFARRYKDELGEEDHAEPLKQLRELLNSGKTLTLLTATKDLDLSQATVLADVLKGQR